MSLGATNPAFSRPLLTWVNWERCINVILALYLFYFLCQIAPSLVEGFRLSICLMLLKVSADTAFHLIRKLAQPITTSFYDRRIGIRGAFTNFLYQPTSEGDMWWAIVLQLCGMFLQVAGMLSLNRSIGFVAADRGVQTSGIHRSVRNPLYFAYCVSFLCLLLNHFTLHNIVINLTIVSLLVLRIVAEHRLLCRSADYQAYKQMVRFRLIPGLFEIAPLGCSLHPRQGVSPRFIRFFWGKWSSGQPFGALPSRGTFD